MLSLTAGICARNWQDQAAQCAFKRVQVSIEDHILSSEQPERYICWHMRANRADFWQVSGRLLAYAGVSRRQGLFPVSRVPMVGYGGG